MNISQLFDQYSELTLSEERSTKMEGYKIILDSGLYLIDVVTPQINKKDRNEHVDDALIVFQMVFGKGIAIYSLIKGIDFKNSINNKSIAGLIDPTAIAALARTQLEAFANFHNIFNSTEDRTLTELLYNLWVVSGLNYRQKSVKEGMAEEHKLKAQREKLKIDVLIDEIHNNKYYTELSEPDQKWLNERIKKRDFELIFRDGKFLKPGWRELFLNSGVKTLFEDLYTIMSWSVHPSNISVFQYAEMFEKGYNINTAFTILDHSKFIMAFMISEYCKYFEVARQSFDQLPLINRLMIESYNRQFRDSKYLISTVWEEYTPLFQSEYEKRIKQQG